MPKYTLKEDTAEKIEFNADDDLYAISKVLNHLGKDKFMTKKFVLTKEVVITTEEQILIPNLSELP